VFVHLNASGGLATINESEEMEGGTPTLVFYDGLADRSHTRTTCEPRAEKQLPVDARNQWLVTHTI